MFGTIDTPDGPVGFHLQTVKPPRVVPAGERHKWNFPTLRNGKADSCRKCGCRKMSRRNPKNGAFEISYQMPGQAPVTERPACPGNTPAS